jgi:hypothetical protein
MVVEKEGRELYTQTFLIAQCTGAAAFGDRMHQQRVDWLGIEHPRSIVQNATAIDTVGPMVDTLKSFARIGLKSDLRSLATQTADHNHQGIADLTLEPAKVSTFHAKMISRYILSNVISFPQYLDTYQPQADHSADGRLSACTHIAGGSKYLRVLASSN